MKLKPNRPVRLGTKMVMTDANGSLPGVNKIAVPESKSLADMTKAQLAAEAERRGVDLDSSDTKAEILGKLEAAA